MITRYDSLDISPDDGNFFLPHNFYSNLKDDIMTTEKYENVKKVYQTMNLKNLGVLNKICSFQDTIILCEIFEQWSDHLQGLFKYNHVNVILQFHLVVVCIEIKVNVWLLFLQTLNMSEFLKKTIIGGFRFSCVNTRLAFDTQISTKDFQQKY